MKRGTVSDSNFSTSRRGIEGSEIEGVNVEKKQECNKSQDCCGVGGSAGLQELRVKDQNGLQSPLVSVVSTFTKYHTSAFLIIIREGLQSQSRNDQGGLHFPRIETSFLSQVSGK